MVSNFFERITRTSLPPLTGIQRRMIELITPRSTSAALIYSLRDQQASTNCPLLAPEDFAAVLHSLRRTKGHLASQLRRAWDTGMQLQT